MTRALGEVYKDRFVRVLTPVATQLERVLKEQLAGVSRVDRISARAKSPIRFLAKAEKLHEGARKYSDPMSQIQDQIGARVVVFYEDDVSEMSTLVERYYHAHERQVLVPESEWEFGYFGLHYVLALPADAVPRDLAIDDAPDVFELQIKTLWQHAWSEANHDLGYKPPEELTVDARRRLALTSAQAWGADRTFAELFRELAPAE